MKNIDEQRRLQAQRDNDYLRGQVNYLNREVGALRDKVAYLERQLEVVLATVNRLTEETSEEKSVGCHWPGVHSDPGEPCGVCAGT